MTNKANAEATASPVVFALNYKVDVMGAGQAFSRGRVFNMDALDLSADVDVSRFTPLGGVSIHLDGLNSSGDTPSPELGIVQGIDNLEVGHRGPRLYQAWIDKKFGAAGTSLRAGFSDPTGEFAVVDSAAYLVAPAFGTAPEYAVSGPNGASSYPSTALGVRLALQPSTDVYVLAAAINARAGVIGERRGVDLSFADGILGLVEAGWTHRGKIAIGGWAFSNSRPVLEAAASGAPDQATQYGIYILADQPLATLSPMFSRANAFVRGGLTDGRTTPLASTLIGGIQVKPAFKSRPDSSLSVGVSRIVFTQAYRTASAADDTPSGAGETLIEVSYSDRLNPISRLQPFAQYVPEPSGPRPAKPTVVLGLRLTIAADTLPKSP